jgi:hypothetical protein
LYICCMASIKVVYDTLLHLVNKDQKGFVTPRVFNEFAGVAQLNIYNRLFDDLKDAHRNQRAGFDPGRDKSLFKRINEDLSTFVRTKTLQKVDGVFERPADVSRIISATTFGSILLGQSTRTPIEMCYDEDKIDRILRSNISSPTEDFPIALISEDIEVFPTSINRMRLKYYKIPQSLAADGSPSTNSPTYGAISFGGGQVYSSASSFDFELPNHYVSLLVIEMARLIGVNLRDANVEAYATGEQANYNQQQSFS